MSAYSFLALALALAAWLPAGRRGPAVALATSIYVVGPVATAIGLIGWTGLRLARLRSHRVRLRRQGASDVVDLARFLLIGAGAGWSLEQSLRAGRNRLHGPVRLEVDDVLRRGRVDGLATALASASGTGTRLWRLLARSHLGGVPVEQALDGFIRDVMSGRRAELIERARRLPVRMVVPLTLLMLPGFVLLVAGPAVLVSGRRLLEPFLT